MTILETALCNLKDEVMLSGYFNRFYPYAELIERGAEKFPQVYTGNGQYKQVYDFDVNGSGYFRKMGSSYISIVGGDRIVSCSDSNPLIDITVPMRLVAAVHKKKTEDNSFSDDTLAFDLISYIGRKQAGITNVQSVHGHVTSYTTDRDKVWSDEVRGINKQVDLNLSYIAIEFNLVMRAKLDCIQQNCAY